MLQDSVSLLQKLIASPSYSRDEAQTAALISKYLAANGVTPHRHNNNIWALCDDFDPVKPTLLLNSHHDTVRPCRGWTMEPHVPAARGGRIYGLGANDAGASVVTLLATFLLLRKEHFKFNILLAITAEEEVGGEGGVRSLLPVLKQQGCYPQMAIVGEPTSLQGAVGERGLLVLDCVASGVSGHAARGEGENAIYKAMADINLLQNFQFPRVSPMLGPIGIAVTQIKAGTQHNVVPDRCEFVVDVRTTDAYTPEETFAIIGKAISSVASPRSFRVRPSALSSSHLLYVAAQRLGITTFVSPTTSDMSLMYDIPSLKIGPGDSSRSHRADEYIEISELEQALSLYPRLLRQIDDTL